MLQAYDQHLNMILGDVEEVITSVEVDDETYEEIIKASAASRCQMLGSKDLDHVHVSLAVAMTHCRTS